MRRFEQEMIAALISTTWSGVQYMKSAPRDAALNMFLDCEMGLNAIENNMRTSLSDSRFAIYKKILDEILHCLNLLKQNLTSGNQTGMVVKEIKKHFDLFKKYLAAEPEVKLEIVFLPYKASMWDSFESIWYAASQDSRCNCRVIPIPYYDREKEQSLGQFHYEGAQFPDYVPIVDYREYDLSVYRPDVIYIHNIYDDQNLVTSVSPEYYTTRLKEYTDMLVYVPYYISYGGAQPIESSVKEFPASISHVSKVVVQKLSYVEILKLLQISTKKILPLGSPKLDFVLKHCSFGREYPFPKSWKISIQKRKVILLNSSISTVLSRENWIDEINSIVKSILEDERFALIFRPHPLLEQTIKVMRPQYLTVYKQIYETIEKAQNGAWDTRSDYVAAFNISDAMISDQSSLIPLYTATQKPILMLWGKSISYRTTRERPFTKFDASELYFVNDGVSVAQFKDLVWHEQDVKKSERLKRLHDSIANADGTCGKKVHQEITKEFFNAK